MRETRETPVLVELIQVMRELADRDPGRFRAAMVEIAAMHVQAKAVTKR